jgi:hypothetical protein
LATHYPPGHHKNRVSEEQRNSVAWAVRCGKMEMQNAVIEAVDRLLKPVSNSDT